MWKFPLHSFISEMDALAIFYAEIIEYTRNHSFSEKENFVLDGQLINPLKIFLLSLDQEFNTDYFYEKIKNLKRTYIKRKYNLVVKVINMKKKPVNNVDIKISELESVLLTPEQFAEGIRTGTNPKKLISSMRTKDYGYIDAKLKEGVYEIEIEKYFLKKTCELHENNELVFVTPVEKHWWQ
jgi:hypothetical protein